LVVECVVCAKQAEIGIILDHSTSIVDPSRGGYDNWEGPVRGFITRLIEAFPIGPALTRVGMVGFSTRAWLEYGFNAYNNSRLMIDAVTDMDINGGETNIAWVSVKSYCSCAIFLPDSRNPDSDHGTPKFE